MPTIQEYLSQYGNDPSAYQNALKAGFTNQDIAGAGLNAAQAGWSAQTLANNALNNNGFNQSQTDAAKQAYAHMQSLVGSGQEAQAKQFYLDKQKALGFTDAQFASLSGTPYNAQQIGEWKGNPAVSPLPNQQMNLGMGAPQPQPQPQGVSPAGQGSGRGSSLDTRYLDPVMDAQQRRMMDQFNESVLPNLRDGAIASGGYGGSRQAIAEQQSLKNLGYGVGDMRANMTNNAWNNQQQMDLGWANHDVNSSMQNAQMNLNYMNHDLNAWNAQQQMNLGMGNQALQAAQVGINAGNQAMQQPWQMLSNYAGIANQVAGNGASQTSPYFTNPVGNAIGGAQLGYGIYNQVTGGGR